jgi:hypothetical protein
MKTSVAGRSRASVSPAFAILHESAHPHILLGNVCVCLS